MAVMVGCDYAQSMCSINVPVHLEADVLTGSSKLQMFQKPVDEKQLAEAQDGLKVGLSVPFHDPFSSLDQWCQHFVSSFQYN